MFTAFERAQKRLKVKHASLKPRQASFVPPRKTLPKSKDSLASVNATTTSILEEKKSVEDSSLDNPIPWPPMPSRNGTSLPTAGTSALCKPGAKPTLSTAVDASITQLMAVKSLSQQESVDSHSWVQALICAGAMAEDLLDAIDEAMDAAESTAVEPTDSELQVPTC